MSEKYIVEFPGLPYFCGYFIKRCRVSIFNFSKYRVEFFSYLMSNRLLIILVKGSCVTFGRFPSKFSNVSIVVKRVLVSFIFSEINGNEMGIPHSPKLQHKWKLTIRILRVISGTLIGRSLTPSAEIQSVYSTAPADWAKKELYEPTFFYILERKSSVILSQAILKNVMKWLFWHISTEIPWNKLSSYLKSF